MFWLVQLLVPICVCVVLPVIIVWIIFRSVTNKDNKNAEIIIKAIESNSAIDADKLVEALSKKQKTPRQILVDRLLTGCIFSFIGLASAIYGIYIQCSQPDTSIQNIAYLVAGFTFAIGIAYLIVCYVTRKALKEDCEK